MCRGLGIGLVLFTVFDSLVFGVWVWIPVWVWFGLGLDWVWILVAGILDWFVIKLVACCLLLIASFGFFYCCLVCVLAYGCLWG